VSKLKQLIGYSFFRSQDEFQQWQLDNESVIVCTVQPNATGLRLEQNEKYKNDTEGGIDWGIFVTYKYPRYRDLDDA